MGPKGKKNRSLHNAKLIIVPDRFHNGTYSFLMVQISDRIWNGLTIQLETSRVYKGHCITIFGSELASYEQNNGTLSINRAS